MTCRRRIKQPGKQEHHSGPAAMLQYGLPGQAPWYVALIHSSCHLPLERGEWEVQTSARTSTRVDVSATMFPCLNCAAREEACLKV